VVLAGAAAGYGGDRRRPVTGVPCAAAAAPQGLRPKDAAKAAAPQRRAPRVKLSRLRRVALVAHPLDCSRPSSLLTARAIRPGAPKVRP
jgi:hypothetical protein